MGQKKHAKGSAFGKHKLKALAEELYEGDGCRFSDDGSPRTTHKGLGERKKYRQKHPPVYEHECEMR